MSRRRVLGTLAAGAAGAAGAAAAGSLLPPSLQSAIAAQAGQAGRPGKGGLGEIRHVVILMQENRSFDHYFGTLRGVRGYADRNAVRLPTGKSVFEQPGALGAGTVLPFSVREAAAAQKQEAQYISDLDHGWEGGSSAWHKGWMDNWVTAKTASTMAHYDRKDIPLQYELADTFTICDAYHSSIHSSTSPNRNHLVSGWTGFEPGTEKRAVGNDAYEEDTHPGYSWKTYAERLEEAGHSWKVYQEWDNFTDNNLEFFASFKAVGKKALAKVDGAENMTAFYKKMAEAPDEDWRKLLLAKLDEGLAALSESERRLFDRALFRGKPGSTAEAFARDVDAGELPEVSYLVPSALECEHPGASSPIQSAAFVYKVLDALGRNPETWRHTALFLTFDENDGYFDHVPPPVPPQGTASEEWQGSPTGLGMRVPMTVISPWTVGGYVCSQVFDHTSVIQFLEKWTGVREPNITAWRRAVTGDLTAAFDFSRARAQPRTEKPGEIPPFKERWKPQPPKEQRMPEQEHGTRPARALPYQPDAYGAYDGKDAFRLTLRNGGRESAHFALLPYAGEYATPRHHDVGAGDEAEVTVPVEDGAYDLVLTGPNGFRREFAGKSGGAAAAVEVTSRVGARRRELHLTVANHGDRTLTFRLEPLAYTDAAPRAIRVAAGGTRTVTHRTAGAQGWYDLALTTDTDDSFRRRLMGHIENGEESVTG
ncbi:phosphocholine-specific phospholipase C [Streptomyces albiaxialis]